MPLEWTTAMHNFCRENSAIPRRELTALFNERFGTNRDYECIRGFCKRQRYMGRLGLFESGRTSWNKGAKGLQIGGVETQFRKGNRPSNALPVGTEKKTTARCGKDPGYWRVKIAEPNKWIFKHRLVWEQANGPMPTGHCIVFRDGNQDNCALENLLLLKRGELAILNKRYNFQSATAGERD